MTAWKSSENPMFRNQFSENIFQNKYAHEGCETWSKLADVLVENVCQDNMTGEEKSQLKEYIRDLKFLPGGRYLYYAGREARFYNNCFKGDTEFLTDNGWRRMDSFDEGENLSCWSPVEQAFLPATMHSHGDQQLYDVTFGPIRGRSQKTWKCTATRNHRWVLVDGTPTENLSVGDVVPAAEVDLGFDNQAFVHGLIFADGTFHYQRKDGTNVYQFRLCGDKAVYLDLILENSVSHRREDADNGDPIVAIESPEDLKSIPLDADIQYQSSFIEGWLCFDGHDDLVRQIHTTDRAAIEWFVENSTLADVVVTGEILTETKPSNFGERNPLHRVNFKKSREFSGFKVTSIEKSSVEKVYCPFEPKHNRIMLRYGIDTFQCFLLKAEEDTREDWADLSWKSESCLMTGGGIGIDYSVYRGEGLKLSRTGGLSSGPIPKMQMINEIGRRVMQGGSRRSAIYASLRWTHPDIDQFLVCKNWDEIPVQGTKFTVADLKRFDFNYAAPMDMTNVSVNYHTDWLTNYWESGELGDVFVKNCEQALRTAEPGFSFNFFKHENETLRNALICVAHLG